MRVVVIQLRRLPVVAIVLARSIRGSTANLFAACLLHDVGFAFFCMAGSFESGAALWYFAAMNSQICVRIVRIAILIVAVGFAVGCSRDDVACGFRFVEIRAPKLPDATLGIPYDGIIEAEIGNEPNDEDYDFRFFLGSGQLPPGLRIRKRNDQQVAVEGTPTRTGVFEFEIIVEAWLDANNDDGVSERCAHLDRDRNFTIVVNSNR